METVSEIIPDDIMKSAEEALDNMLCNCKESCGGYAGMRAESIKDIARVILSERKAAEKREDAMYITGVSDAEAWARRWGHADFADRLVKEVNARADKSGLSKMRASA
jgi:hypothetical protein